MFTVPLHPGLVVCCARQYLRVYIYVRFVFYVCFLCLSAPARRAGALCVRCVRVCTFVHARARACVYDAGHACCRRSGRQEGPAAEAAGPGPHCCNDRPYSSTPPSTVSHDAFTQNGCDGFNAEKALTAANLQSFVGVHPPTSAPGLVPR